MNVSPEEVWESDEMSLNLTPYMAFDGRPGTGASIFISLGLFENQGINDIFPFPKSLLHLEGNANALASLYSPILLEYIRPLATPIDDDVPGLEPDPESVRMFAWEGA